MRPNGILENRNGNFRFARTQITSSSNRQAGVLRDVVSRRKWEWLSIMTFSLANCSRWAVGGGHVLLAARHFFQRAKELVSFFQSKGGKGTPLRKANKPDASTNSNAQERAGRRKCIPRPDDRRPSGRGSRRARPRA